MDSEGNKNQQQQPNNCKIAKSSYNEVEERNEIEKKLKDNVSYGEDKKFLNRNQRRGFRRQAPQNNSKQNRAIFYQNKTNSNASCRVYVGNLSWEVTWRELKDHMKTGGHEVTRADILASHDGRSKGCGIVEFQTVEGAKCAVLTLNDTELMGRQIFVREDREDGSGGGYYTQQIGSLTQANRYINRHTSSEEAQNRRVYVGNLSWDVSWQDLKDHMRQAGEVLFSEVMTDSDGRSKGCGIIEYSLSNDAQKAIKILTDTELKGRMIFVREDREYSSLIDTYQKIAYRNVGTGTSVYVGNLNYETSWQDLKDHMRQAGNVDQANILTGENGRSKGCGIVVYQKVQDANRAIRELQSSILNGRPVIIRESREPTCRNVGRLSSSILNRSDTYIGYQLFIGNLSYDTSWRELKDHFCQCGDVERVEIIEGTNGRKKGFATVRFSKKKDANNAILKLNGVELQGRALEVRLDHKAN